MLYKLLSIPARIALHFYCKRLVVNNREVFNYDGPLLIACNHPNSFLDAIILDILFKQPVYSLARGDAFISPMVKRIFKSLNMLPVYRISEGSENLVYNYDTFDDVEKLFLQNKIVLIFSEGRCENEWHLRPLKKGTARITLSAWSRNIPLKVLPAGINYSNFKHFGKAIHINFGELISKDIFGKQNSFGKQVVDFNQKLTDELSKCVYEIGPSDFSLRKKVFEPANNYLQKLILAIPAFAGFLLNAPFYYLTKLILLNRKDGHYDSILVAIHMLFYPFYWIGLPLLLALISHNNWFLLLWIFMPLTALALLHFKSSVTKKN